MDSGFALRAPRNDNSMPDPENLPCFRGARDLAAGAAGACGDGLDQLAVRCHLGATRLIERIFEPAAQGTAELGAPPRTGPEETVYPPAGATATLNAPQ